MTEYRDRGAVTFGHATIIGRLGLGAAARGDDPRATANCYRFLAFFAAFFAGFFAISPPGLVRAVLAVGYRWITMRGLSRPRSYDM